jgi:DNA polymerase III alpha subunit (gram-positive type)
MKKYILFDTEYTSWEKSQKNNWSKPTEYREIIQIAAFKIKNGEIIDTLNIYVKPNINKKLSKYITKLTGITNHKINTEGISFKKAIAIFYDFSKYYPLYSYGNDYNVIKENIIFNEIHSSKYLKKEWKSKFHDFKDIIKKRTKIDPSKYSSGTIHKALNIKMFKNHKVHNALNDIHSMYEVFKIIL